MATTLLEPTIPAHKLEVLITMPILRNMNSWSELNLESNMSVLYTAMPGVIEAIGRPFYATVKFASKEDAAMFSLVWGDYVVTPFVMSTARARAAGPGRPRKGAV